MALAAIPVAQVAVAHAAPAPHEQTLAASNEAAAPAGSPVEAFPATLSARGYRVTAVGPVCFGAFTLTVADDAGDSFRVDVCTRDESSGSLHGPAHTDRFDLYLVNEGGGDARTHEAHGLVVMDLAQALRRYEAAIVAPGLLTLRERLDRHAGEMIPVGLPVDAPFVVRRVVVGFACNNACVFCAQGDLREREPRRDAEQETIEAAERGEIVAFVGGEPTIAPELLDLVRLARERGAASVGVQTNGRRLGYAAYARALRDAGASFVDVSLHGSTAPMHDYHTGVEGSFVQTVTGIGVARAAGLEVGVSIVVTRSNQRHLADVVRVAHARGARKVRVAVAEPVGRARVAADRIVPTISLVRPYLEDAARVAASLGVALTTGTTEAAPPFVGLGTTDAASGAE